MDSFFSTPYYSWRVFSYSSQNNLQVPKGEASWNSKLLVRDLFYHQCKESVTSGDTLESGGVSNLLDTSRGLQLAAMLKNINKPPLPSPLFLPPPFLSPYPNSPHHLWFLPSSLVGISYQLSSSILLWSSSVLFTVFTPWFALCL